MPGGNKHAVFDAPVGGDKHAVFDAPVAKATAPEPLPERGLLDRFADRNAPASPEPFTTPTGDPHGAADDARPSMAAAAGTRGLESINDSVRGLAQGATLDASDELLGTAQGALGPQSVTAGIEKIRAANRGSHDRSPVGYGVGNALGLGAASLAAPTVGGATVAGRIATGAALGGLQGAAGSDSNNLRDTVTASGLGAAVGGTLSAASEHLLPLAGWLRNRADANLVRGQGVPKLPPDMPGVEGMLAAEIRSNPAYNRSLFGGPEARKAGFLHARDAARADQDAVIAQVPSVHVDTGTAAFHVNREGDALSRLPAPALQAQAKKLYGAGKLLGEQPQIPLADALETYRGYLPTSAEARARGHLANAMTDAMPDTQAHSLAKGMRSEDMADMLAHIGGKHLEPGTGTKLAVSGVGAALGAGVGSHFGDGVGSEVLGAVGGAMGLGGIHPVTHAVGGALASAVPNALAPIQLGLSRAADAASQGALQYAVGGAAAATAALGRGNLLPDAAQTIMARTPGQLGPEFEAVKDDPDKLSALITQKTMTDRNFRENVLPHLRGATNGAKGR